MSEIGIQELFWIGIMKNWLLAIFRDEDAATATEYAVILALILLVVIGAVGAFGSQAGGLWGGIETQLDATSFGGP